MTPRSVAILALPEVQLLDVAGPLDVFAEANAQAGFRAYDLTVVGLTLDPFATSSGLRLVPDGAITEDASDPFDTLLVAGSPVVGRVDPDPAAIDWIRRAAPVARRYGSVCSGAFLLAAAGLLEGKRITTHWAMAGQLAASHPGVTVDVDAIHVREGRLRTAAGVTAGLDLALAPTVLASEFIQTAFQRLPKEKVATVQREDVARPLPIASGTCRG